MNYDVDIDTSALQEDFTRVTTDKKPGNNKKSGSYLDKYLKMPERDGYVTVRLLPALPGFKLPYAACCIHNLAPLEDRKDKKSKNLYCGRTLQGGRWVGDCEFHGYYGHLYRLKDKADDEGDTDLVEQLVAKAKAIKAQEKYYYNAMVIESSNTDQSIDDGPLIYSCGITIHTLILEAVLGNKELGKKPKGNVFHPKTGRNLKIVKKMKPGGQFPDYSGTEWEDPSPLSNDDALIQKWLSGMNDVHSLRKVLSVEEMQREIRIFEGLETDSRKSFDTSFLNPNAVKPVSVSVPAAVPTSTVTTKLVADVDDEPEVDEEFARQVANAIGRVD